MITVACNGTGDFASIQEAIDAAPVYADRPTILLIGPGEYRERVVVYKDNLRLIGSGKDSTLIVNSACAHDRYPDGTEKGTFLSFTMIVTGRNVELENLTVINDAGDGRKAGQALAVYAAGDRNVWRNCGLIGCQDTLFCGPVMPKVLDEIGARRAAMTECVESVGDCPETQSRIYFERCTIRGDVDFIFGPYRAWFEACILYMNGRGGWYTAANTPEHQPFGMVFHKCELTGECAPGAGCLGRPWRRFARTLFMDCGMDECVSPRGFEDWDEQRTVTDRCGEWASRGNGADMSERNPGQKLISDEEAQCITLPAVLGGFDGWRPDIPFPVWYLCGDSIMADYPERQLPMTGWGQALRNLTAGTAYVENCAVNGRSSKSFIEEGRLQQVLACIRKGDRMVIGFGHNDEKSDPSRHTDPFTDFQEYLGQYIDSALKSGADPILTTPVARCFFAPDGSPVATHGDYPAAVRDLALKKNVRLVDLESVTMRMLAEAGEEGSGRFYCRVAAGHPHYPQGISDNSHLSTEGAVLIAAAFLRQMDRSDILKDQWKGRGDQGEINDLIDREDWVLNKP